VPGAANQWSFSFNTWDNWARIISKSPAAKVLLGVPASPSAGSGYVSPMTLAGIIRYSKQFSSFGGVMMWDASQA
jgi:chitinase